MSPRLSAATEAFQAYLEGVRAHPDDQELRHDLTRARAEMETAWLEAVIGVTTSHDGGCW